MAATAGATGRGSACPRDKPAIYKADNGKVIIEDELFNFIVVKMKTLSHDEIILLATNNFSSEWIEESKRVLFEVCPTTTLRCIAHKGLQKDTNNIKACLRLLNECGENIPRFVSHYLDELPPVGFGNMDASALLSRVERLSQEISGLSKALETQAEVSENLGSIAATIDRRVTAMETYRSTDCREPGAALTGRWAHGHAVSGSQEESATPAAVGLDTGTAGHSREEVKGPLEGKTQQDRMDTAAASPLLDQVSPPWTDVVKKGLKKEGLFKTSGPPRSQNKRARLMRVQRNSGIIGTAPESTIGVVKTKLVHVFATKFAPSLDADTLRVYLTGKLENETVTCRKIESARSRYGSFHITAECMNVADMYDPQVWPAGIYVRRFYEARGIRAHNEEGSERRRLGTPAAQRENMAV